MLKGDDNMEKIIGIPRAFNYYRDGILWKTFFETLGCKVLISPNTNKNIIEEGSKYLIDEACLPFKIFMGNVAFLEGKCDYVLVPRINCLKKNEKVCTNFTAIYDICRNVFSNINFLNYNIDITNRQNEIDGFIKIGKELGCSRKKAKEAYINAKKKQNRKYKIKQKKFLDKINIKSDMKILLVGHPYNINDSLIGKDIINYLEKEKVTVLKSDIYNLDHEDYFAKKLAKDIYWTYNLELFSLIEKYKNKVDGIILLSTFPCGPDSLCNELIVRNIKNIPILTLIIDDINSNTGIITRLESFTDIIKTRKEKK